MSKYVVSLPIAFFYDSTADVAASTSFRENLFALSHSWWDSLLAFPTARNHTMFSLPV